MTENDAWDLYFCNLTAMRWHPSNDKYREDVTREITEAANIADKMLNERRRRQCQHGSLQEPASSGALLAPKGKTTPTK